MNVLENVVPQGVWSSDPTHSKVGFEVEHMGLSIFEARFADFNAELVSGPEGVVLRGRVRAQSVDVQDEALRAHLMARGGAWASVLANGKALRVAVNQEMADPATPVKAGDEVAFFPPVTGG